MPPAADHISRQDSMSPDQVLEALLEGNKRFRDGRKTSHDLLEQVEATRAGQWPLAAVVGCIDSRVSPEIVFDLGVGDVFTARVAGNVVNADILGSLEFACKVAGAKLVMVKGHTHCGAIKGACDGVELGHLTGLLGRLSPAIRDVEKSCTHDVRTSKNAAFVQDVAVRNVHRTVEDIRDRSTVLRDMERDGAIKIVGAMYDVETGAISLVE